MAEYSQATADPVTGHKVLLVPQHKRQSDGPAPLSLEDELHDLFNIYVEFIHPQFPTPRGDTIFLRSDGSSFTHGTINKRLPEFWRKSRIRPDLRITATNIRKFIVTICNQKKREGLHVDEEVLRRAMCHSDKVARISYLREDMRAVAAQAMDIIAMCTTGTNPDPGRIEKPSRPSLSKSSATRTEHSAEPSSTTNEPSSSRPLSEPEHQLIQKHFEDVITSSEPIVVDLVKSRMKTEVKLRVLLTQEKMVRKVTDGLRYLQHKSSSEQSPSLPKLKLKKVHRIGSIVQPPCPHKALSG